MNYGLIAIGFILRSKHFKLLLLIMIALVMLPALAIVAIAAAPEILLEEAINGGGIYSTVDPAPTGVAVLGDYSYPGDNYAPGNCTYWAYARRAQVSEPIPNSWGNAATWAFYASIDGYTVDHHPTQYAIMQTANSAEGLGHVAFVENVEPNGDWDISEMNVLGLYIVDHKTEPASVAANYNFIHTKP